LSRFSIAEIRSELLVEGVVTSVGVSTVWRWLNEDAIRPWYHQSWIWPRDPRFAEKAGVVLDLYQGLWNGVALTDKEYVICTDEKTSIQARRRKHETRAAGKGHIVHVEHEYERGGAVAYLVALDVREGKVTGQVHPTTGIEPFHSLVQQVMSQEPYASAKRVFWIGDNGSSHRGASAARRMKEWDKRAVLVNLPVHASWLDQAEIYFSVVQRKALTPNDLPDTAAVTDRLLGFEKRYNLTAKPFNWHFTKQDLHDRLGQI